MENGNRIVRGAAFALLAGLFFGAACGRSRPVLSVYTWSDFIKPEIVARFEREQGCRVVIDTFESNEAMYAKLRAGASGYDLLMPSSYMVSLMQAQGLLARLDHALLPNLVHVDPEYLAMAVDGAMDHSVPYMITNTGIAYLDGRVSDVAPSWRMFGRTDLRGRMTMFNDMRETIGAALKLLGHSINSTDPAELAEAEAVLLEWKKNLAKFDNEQYKLGLASGEFLLVHAWSGDIFQVRRENPAVRFFIPEEGTVISCDDLVVPTDAREVRLAHAFINYLHDPAVAAENTAFIYFLCPNKDSYPLLPAEIRDNPGIFMDPKLRARSEIIGDIGAANALYVAVWDRLKAAR
ncbi:MAG TPA: spermidine/putrescine ABC transporter substrate-binding protein [Candidatus Aminicenantes bacterium]|nr:spermidine/putrescine ABC transporter substrate-binding protein [Candidatus Aminicenantes bacterium]HRY64527.1 spermidine/putrescine ABC transporter substrate-binding protein [Candidatus Aminicenantes bacterium]HRZ71440.1 spermidine/putrescine ABC transporter substrate-binding protein [Candidatus Aminicenantes bacterium]